MLLIFPVLKTYGFASETLLLVKWEETWNLKRIWCILKDSMFVFMCRGSIPLLILWEMILDTKSTKQSPSWEATDFHLKSRISPHTTQPNCSLPCFQKLTTSYFPKASVLKSEALSNLLWHVLNGEQQPFPRPRSKLEDQHLSIVYGCVRLLTLYTAASYLSTLIWRRYSPPANTGRSLSSWHGPTPHCAH